MLEEGSAVFLLLLFLIFLSSFFSSSETALLSVNRVKIEKLARKGNKRAKIVLKLLEDPNKLLTTILIGNNLVNVAIASLTTSLAIQIFGNYGVGIATGVATVLLIIFGEVLPKNFAIKHSELLSLWAAPLLYYFEKLFYPFTLILLKLVERLFGKKIKEKLSEEELKIILEKEGALKKEELELINNIFELDEIKVKEIMTPRTKIVAVDEESSLDKILETIKKTSYSKIPVFKDNLDNITGVVLLKDVLKNLGKNIKAKDIKRPVYFVPESKNIADLFKEMKEKKIKIALVVDEFGGIAGLITLEDILDYLVGKINDKRNGIVKLNDKIFVVNGDTSLMELEREMEREINVDEGISTVAGLLMHYLQRVPKKGDKLVIDDLIFEVVEMKGSKIERVRIFKK